MLSLNCIPVNTIVLQYGDIFPSQWYGLLNHPLSWNRHVFQHPAILTPFPAIQFHLRCTIANPVLKAHNKPRKGEPFPSYGV
jgi:hypothetical protein